jgi:tetratricopeptide (TPR) repeat protein
MQKISPTGLMVLVCLLLCFQKSPAWSASDAQESSGGSQSANGPGPNFINAVMESAQKNPEAGRIVIEGVNAIQRNDLAGAEERFQRVLAMDPKFFGIHLLLGSVYLEKGKPEQGLAELRKEEEYHPGNAAVYEAASEILLDSNYKQEALASLRKWVAAEPKSIDAALKLGALLGYDKQYAEAVQVLQHAYALNPESSKLQASLAEAYFLNHQPEQGTSLLKKGLPPSTSPEDLGRAANVLADNNVELDLANKYAERALFQLEAESAAATDEEIGIGNTLKLGYLWDVMGWIDFRRGDYRAAVLSLEAAWLLSQSPETGDHLGQAYEKLGKKEEAAHTYLLAVASANGDADDARKRYQALTGKKVSGVPGNAPVEELSRLRTVNLTKSPHEPVNAIFSIVFSTNKPTEVKYLSGAESLKTMVGPIASAKFNVKFPDASTVRLFRRGMVACGTVRGCDVVLLLPDSVHFAE